MSIENREQRAARSSDPGPRTSLLLGVLPGSRTQEVRRNVPVMLQVLRRVHAKHPQVRFPVACYREAHREHIRSLLTGESAALPIDLYVGRTPEIIASADCCLMVSGSVSLELLARGTPAVVLYCGSVFTELMVRLLVTCKYMSLPNLMVDRPMIPEFPISRGVEQHVQKMSGILDDWLSNPESLDAARSELLDLRKSAARTGGVARAADAVLRRVASGVEPHRLRGAA